MAVVDSSGASGWTLAVPVEKLAVHFVTYDGLLAKRIVIPHAKCTPDFLSVIGSKFSFTVSSESISDALTIQSDDVHVMIMRKDERRFDDLYDSEVDSWVNVSDGANIYVLPPSPAIISGVHDNVFGASTGTSRSSSFGASQDSGAFGLSTQSLSSCSSLANLSLKSADFDLDSTLRNPSTVTPASSSQTTALASTIDSLVYDILAPVVSVSQQEYQAVCTTVDPCGSGSVTVNVSAALPLGTRPQPPITEPSSRYAATYDQQLLHALSATCPAGFSGHGGSDLPLTSSPVVGARLDQDEYFETEAAFEVTGHVAESEGRAYYRDGEANSLVWHHGVDVDKVVQSKHRLMCLMTPHEMIDVWQVLKEQVSPKDYIMVRKDFCEALFKKMLDGRAGARKTFFNAKRLLFNALYDFMLEKMSGGFSAVNNRLVGVSLWFANQWCCAQYWCATPDQTVHVPPFLYMVSADKNCRGIWNQHVYFVRGQKALAASSNSTVKCDDEGGDGPTVAELVTACAEPPVPDYTMMLSGSQALREATDLIALIGKKHMDVMMVDDLCVDDKRYLKPVDLNKERGLASMTYGVRRAKVDTNRSYFTAERQINLCPALLFNKHVAHEEFVRMRQCIVRYAPNSAVYSRQCYEYLLSRMASAAICHFSKRSRMTSAKGILGCLPLTGSYEYQSYFHLPYDDFLLTGLRTAVHYACRESVTSKPIQELLRSIVVASKASEGKAGAMDAVGVSAQSVTTVIPISRLPIMVVPTQCGTFEGLMTAQPYLVIDNNIVQCVSALDMICRWFESYWIFNLRYPPELSEFFVVLEAIYGFLPVAGGMYGPLTLSQPKRMAKRLIACVSQVMQSDGYIMSGVKLNQSEREERNKLISHVGSPYPPHTLIALGVALPNGQAMRTVRPNNERLSMGNAHAAEAVERLQKSAARRRALGDVAKQQRKGQKFKGCGLEDVGVVRHMTSQLSGLDINSSDQLAAAASTIVADDANVLDRSTSVDVSPNENGKRKKTCRGSHPKQPEPDVTVPKADGVLSKPPKPPAPKVRRNNVAMPVSTSPQSASIVRSSSTTRPASRERELTTRPQSTRIVPSSPTTRPTSRQRELVTPAKSAESSGASTSRVLRSRATPTDKKPLSQVSLSPALKKPPPRVPPRYTLGANATLPMSPAQ